jgi:hypothetical protein
MKYLAPIALVIASIVFLVNSTSTMETSNRPVKIARIWRGWTSLENAPKLEAILRDEAIPNIENNKPEGLRGIQLFTLQNGDEIMFTTVMYFDSIESVKAFAGEEYSKAHIDPAVRPLLLRYDEVVAHHTVKESRNW